MLGKKNSYWEEKESLQTVQQISDQPAQWKKVQKQVRDQKDALKAFLEPALAASDLTIIFNGLTGIVAQTVYSWMDAEVRYNTRYLAEGEVLESDKNYVMISIEDEGNTMKLAADIDRQPEPVRQLIVTGDADSPLVKAAREMTNMYGLVAENAKISGLMLAAFMTLHLEILDDLQVDDMIHSASHVLNQSSSDIEKFVEDNSFGAIRAVGFNVRQKRHALKEMAGVIKVAFVSPYTGMPYDGTPLNLVYLPDEPNMKSEQLELIKALRRDGQLVYAVEARHDGEFNCDGQLDLKLLMARNNVYAAFSFLTVLEAMTAFKAARHNISLDEPDGYIQVTLDSWQEKQTFDDAIEV